MCPKGPGDPGYAVLDGVELYKYRPYARRAGWRPSSWSTSTRSWPRYLALEAGRGRLRRRPELQPTRYLLADRPALPPPLYGSRFVFDHHDLCPETFESRFPEGSRCLPGSALPGAPDGRAADHVISTNGSYRAVVMERHGVRPDHITVVRTGPDPVRSDPVAADPLEARPRASGRLYRRHGAAGWRQHRPRGCRLIVNKQQRKDITFTLIGSGDCFNDLVEQRDRLNLVDFVEFTGRVPDETVAPFCRALTSGCPLTPGTRSTICRR